MNHRVERDSMGEMRVPNDALYGPQTQRAVENFPISSLRLPRAFIQALGLIKAAAARTNAKLGYIPEEIAEAISIAAADVSTGKYDAEFVVDVVPDRKRHLHEHERKRGDWASFHAHANDHVNQGQSSNDVFPTAMHVSAALVITEKLIPAMSSLAGALEAKSREFHDVLKIGRTHLQDAVPMRLGQEFSGYTAQVRHAIDRLDAALAGIYELPLGGTAIGTGLNALPGFAKATIEELADKTNLPFREASNHFEAQASKDAIVFLSAALRNYAVALTKIANDIRWLGSGPRCGLGELKLPETQPGSSIMPGKVNPVIAESVLMVCAQVIGYDATIAWCGAAGNFELNVMMPVMAYDLLHAVELLSTVSRNFELKLVRGLQADRERAASLVEQSLAMVTVLAPEIGYDKAAAISKEAYSAGLTIRQVAREKSGITEDRLSELLNPEKQAGENT